MTEAPATEAMTEATATEAMTEAPYDGMSQSADCDAQKGSASPIKEIKAVARLTVQFTMCQPDPAFLTKIAFIAFGIQPKEYLEANGPNQQVLRNPVGTGPYKLAEFQRFLSPYMLGGNTLDSRHNFRQKSKKHKHVGFYP